ncbi:MAG: TetR/AcrR family transcriptional regulator [Bacteroidales bacterium]|nr:TetR/AcrR family transcriptional regulator [Bacteroidales bacterium]
MKEYFIQATKDILKGEGIQSISVRNIANQAGYSYATLYNYFKDVNDLVFLCVSDFQEECRVFVENRTKGIKKGKERLKKDIQGYIEFFCEYPGIFELFYLTRMSDFGGKKSIIHVINNSLSDICEEDWGECLNQKIINSHEVDIKKGY